MPIDAILVSAAVVTIFVVFAGVLVWADFQLPTPGRTSLDAQKRRPF